MRSWPLYFPASLIEIHPHMKYQLATINRSWDSTLDINVNLVYGRTHIRTTRTFYAPGGPRPRGHKNTAIRPDVSRFVPQKEWIAVYRLYRPTLQMSNSLKRNSIFRLRKCSSGILGCWRRYTKCTKCQFWRKQLPQSSCISNEFYNLNVWAFKDRF